MIAASGDKPAEIDQVLEAFIDAGESAITSSDAALMPPPPSRGAQLSELGRLLAQIPFRPAPYVSHTLDLLQVSPILTEALFVSSVDAVRLSAKPFCLVTCRD